MNSDIIIKASFLHNQRKTSRVVIDLTQEPDASQNDRKRKQQASLSAVKTQRNKKKHSSLPLRFDTDHTISENLFDLSLSSPQINPQGTLTPERRLGSGSYGVVNSVVDSKGNRFACKVLRTQETKDNANPYSDYTSILREIAILSTFQGHPNIVRCFSCNLNRRADTYEIVMELMDGDLSSICRNNDAEQRMHHFQSIAYQILSGVAYLHTEGFSHRDIKSSNILYRKRRDGSLEIKLTDFGLARRLTGPCYTGGLVTLPYRPPELLFSKAKTLDYTTEVDVWSVGIVLSEILLGFKMTGNGDEAAQMRMLAQIFDLSCFNATSSYPAGKHVGLREHITSFFKIPPNPAILDLLEKLLQPNPRKRITAREALQHPYFKNHVPICNTFVQRPKYLPRNVSNWFYRHRALDEKKDRDDAIDLISDLCVDFNYSPETLSQAVELLDAYMNNSREPVENKQRLDLVSYSCLLLSSYLNEYIAEPAETLAETERIYTGDQIMDTMMEVYSCLHHLLPKSRLSLDAIKRNAVEDKVKLRKQYKVFPTLDIRI